MELQEIEQPAGLLNIKRIDVSYSKQYDPQKYQKTDEQNNYSQNQIMTTNMSNHDENCKLVDKKAKKQAVSRYKTISSSETVVSVRQKKKKNLEVIRQINKVIQEMMAYIRKSYKEYFSKNDMDSLSYDKYKR